MTMLADQSALVDPARMAAIDSQALTESHQSVFDNFISFSLCVHKFGSKRTVDCVDATFDGQILSDDLVDSARAKLIPPAWAKQIDKAGRAVRELAKRYCLRGDADGCYLVNVERAEEFFVKFNAAVAEHDRVADDMAAHYAEIRQEIRENWRERMPDDLTFHENIGKYLPLNELDLRCRYEVEYKVLNPEETTKYMRRLKNGPVKNWMEMAHRRALEHVAERRKAQFRQPLEQLVASIAAIRLKITEAKRIREETFTAFDDAVVLFRICANLYSPELVQDIDELARTVATIRENANRSAGRGPLSFTNMVKNSGEHINNLFERVTAACTTSIEQNAEDPRLMGRRGLRLNSQD